MILDRLEFAARYIGMHAGFDAAFDFLNRPELAQLGPGKILIANDDIFAVVGKDPARTAEEARLEAHRKYIDIQYVVAGTDHMGWKNCARCDDPVDEYDDEKDIIFYNNTPDLWVAVPAGAFVVFFPEDAHAPLVGEGMIHKVVVKVAV